MIVPAAEKVQRSPLLSRHSLTVSIAASPDEIEQCLKLRHQVFAEEMGAQLESMHTGLDVDYFDGYAKHLVVTDNDNGQGWKMAQPEKGPESRRTHIQQAMGRSGKSPEQL